jgi:hypothetical protein
VGARLSGRADLEGPQALDVGSLHEYDYDYNQSNTIVSPHLAATLQGLYVNNKPLIVGETGILSGGAGCRTSLSGRSTADRQKFDGYLLSGAAGVLVWNYSPSVPELCPRRVCAGTRPAACCGFSVRRGRWSWRGSGTG